MKIALLIAALATGRPPPASAPCLNDAEARAVTLVALPEILHQSGLVCGARLPASAALRSEGPAMARYRTEADRAWPAARGAIAKLADPAAAVLLQSDYARPLLVSLVVPQLVGRIDPADCATLDRLVTLLQPLPPANVAGVVVTALGWLKNQKAKGKAADAPDLPLCAGAPR